MLVPASLLLLLLAQKTALFWRQHDSTEVQICDGLQPGVWGLLCFCTSTMSRGAE